MNSTGLLIIGGGAFLLLASKKSAVAQSANLTAQQRQALANANQQNSLFSGLGSLLRSALNPPKASAGGSSPRPGVGGTPGGTPLSGHPSGPVTDPCAFCPATGLNPAGDTQTPGGFFCSPAGPPAPCEPTSGLGPCVTPCTLPNTSVAGPQCFPATPDFGGCSTMCNFCFGGCG